MVLSQNEAWNLSRDKIGEAVLVDPEIQNIVKEGGQRMWKSKTLTGCKKKKVFFFLGVILKSLLSNQLNSYRFWEFIFGAGFAKERYNKLQPGTTPKKNWA